MELAFTKLFNKIVTSSVWSEDDKTRIMWITMLALSDRNGYVAAALPGLADVSRMSLEDAKAAVLKLESPDQYSRNKELDGKRIVPVDGGWEIVTYNEHRQLLSQVERREYKAEWIRKRRKKERRLSTNVDRVSTSVTQAEAEAEADNNNPPTPFEEFWNVYPKKQSKPDAKKAWDKLKQSDYPNVMAGLERWKNALDWKRDNGQFIPYPATFLNKRKWEDLPLSLNNKDGKLEEQMRKVYDQIGKG